MQKVTVTIDKGGGGTENYEGLRCYNNDGIKLKDWQWEGNPPHKGFIFFPWSHVIKVEDIDE